MNKPSYYPTAMKRRSERNALLQHRLEVGQSGKNCRFNSSHAKHAVAAPQRPYITARLSRACDNCRNGRFKCTKITGEELSPCTKCKSLGESTEECTYLRPRLRPGPLTGVPRASTKVPTMFHEQRNVSAENYKHPDGPPPALGSWNFKNIQPRFGTGANTAISEGVDPRYQDPRRNSERRDLSIHIYDPSGDCRIHAASDKSVAQRSSFLRPMLWVRTENLNSSTSTSLPRDKKHMFVD